MNNGTVTIESLAHGGYGVSRHKGKVIFIPYTAPGDIVAFELTTDRKKFSFAKALEILTPSGDRVVPRCPLFERCGGCQWQHIKYERQLLEKGDIVKESFSRIAKADVSIDDVVRSPKVDDDSEGDGYQYRARVDLSFAGGGRGRGGGNRNRSGAMTVGHLAPKSREIVPVFECPVLLPEIERILPKLPEALGILGVSGDGGVRLVSGDGGEVCAMVNVRGAFRGDRRVVGKFVNHLGLKGATVIFGGGALTSGDSTVRLSVGDGGKPLKLSAGGFIQGNPGVNALLLRALLKYDFSQKRVLELYSGGGNFSIPILAANVIDTDTNADSNIKRTSIFGVETNRTSVQDARRNARAFGLSGIKFVVGDSANVVDGLSQSKVEGRGFDTVILNPPREGAKEAISGILKLRPADIFYVSCAPPTLSRDVGVLMEGGYGVREVIPFDMFPQTYHVETLCHLAL